MTGGRAPRFEGKVALITGASSGLGEEMACQFAREGARVVLFARRGDRLESLARRLKAEGAEALAVEGDVRVDGDPERAVARGIERFGRIDIAVANAGFSVGGAFQDLSLDDYRRQFETNVFGVLRTAYAALPELKRTSGRLVLIGSIAGHLSLPRVSPYSMSKHAVRALANSIAPELRAEGVTVVQVSLGFVDSDIRRVDNAGVFHEERGEPIPSWILMPTSQAAREVLDAIHRGDADHVVTAHGRAVLLLQRLLPGTAKAVVEKSATLRFPTRG